MDKKKQKKRTYPVNDLFLKILYKNCGYLISTGTFLLQINPSRICGHKVLYLLTKPEEFSLNSNFAKLENISSEITLGCRLSNVIQCSQSEEMLKLLLN